MTRTLKNLAPATALALCFTASATAQDLTPAEKQSALQYLDDTRDKLVKTVRGLSQAQLRFKPAPDRWSVAEVAEHLAVLEELFAKTVCPQLKAAPPGTSTADARQFDALILAKVPDRSTKAKAPASIEPTGRWTPEESLERFVNAREETSAFLTNGENLRAHVMSHPALGPLDAYQWVLAVAAHTDRHIQQILEVEADPQFPRDGVR